jgi:hypothetical protein
LLGQQHKGCAADCDEHHPSNSNGFVVGTAFEPNEPANQSCGEQTYEDTGDSGL